MVRNKYEIIRKKVEMEDAGKITFSFEYYDTKRNDYCLSTWQKEHIAEVLRRLKDINNKTFNDLSREAKVYHFSQVIWEQTNEKQGFPDDRLKKLSPFHFSLIGINNQKARVYGAYAQNIFYIVWFDFDHKIWNSFKKNT